ncbi:MAG: acetate/propionate family kinase [Pseudomonadota bacterium]
MNALSILVFNSGSSSLKFSFFRMESSFFDDSTNEKYPTESILGEMPLPETFPLKTLFYGEMEMGQADLSRFYVKDGSNKTLVDEQIRAITVADATLHILRYLAGFSTPSPEVIAHRVVHGGVGLVEHSFINDKVLRQLKASVEFAPLHNQTALEIIHFTRKLFPKLPQVVCFDTAFHADMPDVAKLLPISKDLHAMGIQRYGFHGLSCESVIGKLGKDLPEKLIIAHLGNGASVTAVKNGQSVDTSMGLTPSGGVMMGTRCGDLDPGVLIYLMREKKYDLSSIESLINHQSGLLGVSAVSSDMRILHESAPSNPDAQLAIDMFCSSIAKQIAAMTSVLNGVDALVFTGGIGENDALIRCAICAKLAFFGLTIDAEKNQSTHAEHGADSISDASSSVEIYVAHSNENAQIARHTWMLLFHHEHPAVLNNRALSY